MNAHLTKIIAVAGLVLDLGPAMAAVPQERPLFIKGGRIVTVGHGTLDPGAVLIRAGRIAAVGQDLQAPADAQVIDATGAFVLPGFIDASTTLGTVDWASVERDDDEAATTLTAQVRALDAFNPDSRLIAEARRQGVTTALVAPARGNLLAGQGGLVHLDGGDLPSSTVLSPASVHGTLGEVFKLRSKVNAASPFTRMGAAALLRQTLIDARAYRDRPATAAEAQPGLLALAPVLDGRLPLVIAANKKDDILTALRIAREFGLRIVISQGAEAWKLGDELAAAKVPVLIMPRTALGLTVETAGGRHDNPKLLSDAGVRIAFQSSSAENVADLLALAQDAVRYGLSPGEALRALTLAPAEIFGVASEIGSIETGKRADMVIFTGHPLLSPARVKAVIIGGRLLAEPRIP